MRVLWRSLAVGAALMAATLVIGGQITGLLGGPVRLQAADTALIAPAGDTHQGHDLGATAPSGVGAAPAAAVPGPNAARVQLSIAPAAKASTGYVLTAQVTTPAGTGAANANVGFYEIVDLLGTREMFIGEATTDGHGTASLLYLPANAGTHQLVVRASGAKLTPGESRSTLEATVAAPSYRTEVTALSRFSAMVPYGVGAVVLAVWLLIAFALIGTARGVLQGAGSEKEKGVIA